MMATPSAGDEPECLPRNFTRPSLLVLLAEGSSHGYDLLERLDGIGLDRIDSGSLYRALRSMEREELVRSWWEPPESGPARRTYELTDAGIDSLHRWASSVRRSHGVLGRYLDRYEAVIQEAGSSTR